LGAGGRERREYLGEERGVEGREGEGVFIHPVEAFPIKSQHKLCYIS